MSKFFLDILYIVTLKSEKTSMQQDQALWQKFKGSKSFADLAANIATNERLEQ